jgi:hypothetical protein
MSKKNLEARQPLNMRTSPELRARLEESAERNRLSLTQEVMRRIDQSFEADRSNSSERKMDAFWAYFDGICDAQQPESNEAVLLELIRHRLETATGFRVALTPPEKPKLVASA